jgi:ASC-1-like (ASCH) protein
MPLKPAAAECGVAAPWFDHLRKGRKNVEGRLYKGTFAALRKGHLLTVHSSGDGPVRSFQLAVVDVRRYRTFKEYLEMEGLRPPRHRNGRRGRSRVPPVLLAGERT